MDLIDRNPEDTRRRDAIYQPFISEAGEELFVPSDPVDRMLRGKQFADRLGLPLSKLVNSLLVSVPIPRYVEDVTGPHRWTDIEPDMLWHPLLWLPERLHTRYTLDGEAEGDDAWALRVMFEMGTSGLYDSTSGEWVDVLATFGVDLSNPDHHERVAAWLLGVPDEVLDSINLDDLLYIDEDPDWAIVAAGAMEGPAKRTLWAAAARVLLAWCDDAVAAFNDSEDVSVFRTRVGAVVRLGVTLFAGTTPTGEVAAGDGDDLGYWAESADRLADVADGDLSTWLSDRVAGHLYEIYDAHHDEMVEFWDTYARELEQAAS